jgi:hypothetical protein
MISRSAAAGEDLNIGAHPLSPPLAAQPSLMGRTDPPTRELLGDALGNWMGVKAGRWDLFHATLFDDGTAGDEANSPVIAGTIRKNAAEIQLRWHPGE